MYRITAANNKQCIMATTEPRHTWKYTLNMIFLAFIFLVYISSSSAQSLGATAVAQTLLGQGLLLEAKPVGVPQATAAVDAAAASAIQPAVSATVTRVRRRNTAQQAAQARRRAKPWRPVLNTTRPGDSYGPSSICGANQLVADNSLSNCHIIVTYPTNGASSCSAFKIGNNLLGTAGHCVYSTEHGGWARSVDVYCKGWQSCTWQSATTYGTYIATTPSWIASPTNIPTAWDGAVIKTAGELPGPALQLAQYGRTGSFNVKLTGYPAQNVQMPGCENSAYAQQCYQYSSTDLMTVTSSDMYSSNSLDLCSGHSGSSVVTADSNYVVAIVTGASIDPCMNYFVPQINSDGVNGDCEKPSGGVSLACLAGKLGV